MKNVLLLVAISIFLFSNSYSQVNTAHGFQPISGELIRVSPPLRDIPKHSYPKHPVRKERENPSLEQQQPITNPNAQPQGADPMWQKDFPSGVRDVNIDVLSTWEGMSENVDPSDNTIAVGPNHVVQMVNGATETYLRIWDKSGAVLIDELAVSDISGINDIGDPNLVYDPIADRFVMLVINSNLNKIVTCITQTGDPTGSWYAYQFSTSNGLPDYPKMGLWGNSYFITTNSNSPTVWAINRDSLLIGAPIGSAQKFTMSSLPTLGFQSASPVHFTGSQLPDADTPAYIIRVADDAWGGNLDSDHLEIFHVNINWHNSDSSYIQGPFNIGTAPYNSSLCGFNSFSCIPQPGTNSKLDPLSNILMDKVQYRRFDDHESIVCSQVCNADGNGLAGIRWYELRKSSGGDWYVYQQGTYEPDDSIYRWMPSISMNDDGAIALGYNVSNHSGVYPGARITGRAACDSSDLMTAGEVVMVNGSHKNSSERYGDYNGMMTDPVDGSFWFTAQYNPESNWSTAVIHFTISDCIATSTQEIILDHDLKIVPVPADETIDVTLTSKSEGPSMIQILDRSGVVVSEQIISLSPGNNQFRFNVKNLPNGFYLLKIPREEGAVIGKLMIQHE